MSIGVSFLFERSSTSNCFLVWTLSVVLPYAAGLFQPIDPFPSKIPEVSEIEVFASCEKRGVPYGGDALVIFAVGIDFTDGVPNL